MQGTHQYLARGSIQEMEAQQQKARTEAEYERKLNSHKSIQSGGALTAEDALIKIKARRQKEAMIALSKAQKDIKDFCATAAKAHHRVVNARKAEREQKNTLKELYKARDFPDPLSLIPIRNPENCPADAEKEALQPDPALLQALKIAEEELVGFTLKAS
jgi:hypothetical protein